MEGKKFNTILEEYCAKRNFSPEESTNFQIYVVGVFQEVKKLMDSREYDFIAVRKLGTFFLKVWTVHSRMKELEKRLTGYLGPRMSTNQYRDEKKRYDELTKIYERMTTDFFNRKLYFAEKKRERKEKRLNQQLMMDIAMEDIERDYKEDKLKRAEKQEKDETDRDTKTGLGEQE